LKRWQPLEVELKFPFVPLFSKGEFFSAGFPNPLGKRGEGEKKRGRGDGTE
jgi:hypothetical protein